MGTLRMFVGDVDIAVKFYSEALGFELAERWGPAFAMVSRGSLTLWLSGPGTSAAKPWTDGTVPVPGGHTRPVIELTDLEPVLDAVEKLGGKVLNGPLTGPGGTQVVIADPDGNKVELFVARE